MGLAENAAFDSDALTGMFTRFRPNGAGLERLFEQDPVQLAVLARIKNVFHASALSWRPTDFYFVMRVFDPLSEREARKLADEHLAAMQQLADFVGDTETQHAISLLRASPDASGDDVISTLVYDCLTDFLAGFDASQNALFVLDEALYSMANDYYLMAYMLWPAIQQQTGLPALLDPYFEMWRHGLQLADDGSVSVAAGQPL